MPTQAPDPFALTGTRFPAACIEVLAPFFDRSLLASVRLRVLQPDSWQGWAIQQLGMTGASVRGRTLYVYPDVLDADGRVMNPHWRWNSPYGVSKWAHEVYHVQQYSHYTWRDALAYVTGLLQSWIHGSWYDHAYFPAERAASAYQQHVYNTLKAQNYPSTFPKD